MTVRTQRRTIVTAITTLLILCCQNDPAGHDPDVPFEWELSSPQVEGLDSTALEQAFANAGRLPFVHSVLIIRHGRLAAEEYFQGFRSTHGHNVKSVSKSFLSVLVGIALDEGHLKGLDEKVLDFFPDIETTDPDPRMQQITIRHLLTMRAGYDTERNNYSQIFGSSNWVETILNFPLTYNPDDQFSYNTCQTHLLSAILTRAAGMSTKEFAERYLFDPLNITIRSWAIDAQGNYFGGNNMHFTARDMAKLGYLYLKRGKVGGQRIVSSDWVKASLENSISTNSTSWWGLLNEVNYGYLWWLGELGDHESFLAVGHGGQFVITIADLDMIIVTTSEPSVGSETSDEQIRGVLELVSNDILPAVIN
jgi:CubicO group peptidase (beta-lactamase class C family)